MLQSKFDKFTSFNLGHGAIDMAQCKGFIELHIEQGTAMIFARKDKARHNFDEAMNLKNFLTATGPLSWQLNQ